MWEIFLTAVVVCSAALLGFRWWLDRVHPPPSPEAKIGADWEERFQKLKEAVDEINFGREFRGRGRESE